MGNGDIKIIMVCTLGYSRQRSDWRLHGRSLHEPSAQPTLASPIASAGRLPSPTAVLADGAGLGRVVCTTHRYARGEIIFTDMPVVRGSCAACPGCGGSRGCDGCLWRLVLV